MRYRLRVHGLRVPYTTCICYNQNGTNVPTVPVTARTYKCVLVGTGVAAWQWNTVPLSNSSDCVRKLPST
jgi:hypothetical protein